jgi:hypothetical protein
VNNSAAFGGGMRGSNESSDGKMPASTPLRLRMCIFVVVVSISTRWLLK